MEDEDGLYSNSFLSSLDWIKLVDNILANEYSYYTVQLVNHLVQSLLENTDAPNLEKLRTWLPVIKLHKKGSNSTVYKICRYNKPFIVLKNNICKSDLELNSLRSECLFFPWIYAKLDAGKIIDDGEVVLALFPTIGKKLEYMFCEMVTYEYSLDSFLRGVESSFEDYLALYAQVIKSMDLAYKRNAYVNKKLETSKLVVSYENDVLMKIPIGKEHIIAKRIVRSLNCDVSEGKPSEAIYNFTGSFIYNLLCRHNKTLASRKMSSLLMDLLLHLKVPVYYLNRITKLMPWQIEDIPSELDDVGYQDVLKYLSSALIGILFEEEAIEIGQKFELDNSITDEQGIIHLFYSSQSYKDQTSWLSAYISKNNSIKYQIDDSFIEIDSIRECLHTNVSSLINLPINTVEQYYRNILVYFETLLYIKLLLDELKQRLSFFRELKEDIINDILHSYIVENGAKLARKAAEYIEVYETSLLVMPKNDIIKIKTIWQLLDATESLK